MLVIISVSVFLFISTSSISSKLLFLISLSSIEKPVYLYSSELLDLSFETDVKLYLKLLTFINSLNLLLSFSNSFCNSIKLFVYVTILFLILEKATI